MSFLILFLRGRVILLAHTQNFQVPSFIGISRTQDLLLRRFQGIKQIHQYRTSRCDEPRRCRISITDAQESQGSGMFRQVRAITFRGVPGGAIPKNLASAKLFDFVLDSQDHLFIVDDRQGWTACRRSYSTKHPWAAAVCSAMGLTSAKTLRPSSRSKNRAVTDAGLIGNYTGRFPVLEYTKFRGDGFFGVYPVHECDIHWLRSPPPVSRTASRCRRLLAAMRFRRNIGRL